ncbi:hypothetical protein D3C85_1666370 [compost metagenome]
MARRMEIGDQQQDRQEADALADDAQAHRRAGQVEPAPGWPEQQVAQHAVETQRHPQAQEAVDLPGAQDAVALVGGQEQQGGDHADAPVPQAPPQVMQHPGNGRRRQQPWQVQGNLG